jgi:predicted ATPase
MEKKKIKTAIDYIKESTLFSSDIYNPIKPLFEKLLNDTLKRRDIYDLLDSIAPLLEKTISHNVERIDFKNDNNSKPDNKPIQEEIFNIKLIKTIVSLDKIGLIDEFKPLDLSPGINILFGLNASGKSSVYKGMCNALGFHDKIIFSNLNLDKTNSSCSVKVEDYEGKEHEPRWESGKFNPKSNIKIFDYDISLSLVRDDQDNSFSLGHLKKEYFYKFMELYEEIEKKLDGRKQILAEQFDVLERSLQAKIGSLYDDLTNKTIDKDYIEKCTISDADLKLLVQLKAELDELNKVNFGDKIKLINVPIEDVEKIIMVLTKGNDAGEDENIEQDYLNLKLQDTKKLVLSHGYRKLKEIDEEIENNIKLKALVEKESISEISRIVTADWIKRDTWKEFIEKSIEFVSSLSEKEQKIYLEEKCPYCFQDLDKGGKKLIKSYRKLQSAIKQGFNESNIRLSQSLDSIQNILNKFEKLDETEKGIETNIKDFIKVPLEKPNNTILMNFFRKILDSINKRDSLKPLVEDVENVKKYIEYYMSIYNALSIKRKKFEDKIRNKLIQARQLEVKIEPLAKLECINDNKSDLLKFLQLQERFGHIDTFLDLLVSAKRVTSKCQTYFSSDVVIEDFQKILDKEYEKLNFKKPEKYKLITSTSGAENKRLYKIGDKKIGEIFSEGEQKQHALADFFAQAEMEEFQGVYIFDDPVTSLDHCNVEYVAERIVQLHNNRDNQAIIFTHNKVFLQCLLDKIGEKTKMHRFNRVTPNKIFIEINVSREATQELRNNWQSIQDRMKVLKKQFESSALVDKQEIKVIYGFISMCLEDIVEVHILKETIIKFRPYVRVSRLKEIDWNPDLVTSLVPFYHKVSRIANRHGAIEGVVVPDYTELNTDVVKLKGIIEIFKK